MRWHAVPSSMSMLARFRPRASCVGTNGLRSSAEPASSDFENKALCNVKRPVKVTPIPSARRGVTRRGDHLTIVATQLILHQALTVADRLAGRGVSIEVIYRRAFTRLTSRP